MVGTAYPMKVSEALLATAASAPLKAIDMVNAFSISTLAAKPSFPGPGMWLHGSNRALMRRILNGPNATGCTVNLFHHDFSVCDRYDGGLEAAARVTARVTMVLGQQDQMTPPRATRDIAAALKAKVVMVPAGHSIPAEAPDPMLAALQAALR
jgi:pimeloyl-ACP methyl ester carboxylesterase